METISLKRKSGAGAQMTFAIPKALQDKDLDILVVLNPIAELNAETALRDENGWPIGFLDATYGNMADDPIERLPQGELEIREATPANEWRYLVARPHAWRRQLYVKGRRLMASTVWREMLINKLSAEEAADNWKLPHAAIAEITRYCEANRDLLAMESDEERRFLLAEGVAIEPAPVDR